MYNYVLVFLVAQKVIFISFCSLSYHSLFLDTCQGDSGGPLMMFTSSNQWLLVGLTSNGVGCAQAAYAGVYTRVAAFQSWIKSYTNDSSWITVNLQSSTSSTSTSHIFSFIALIFFVIFYY
jgi:secreted trypsin-like serine protease